MPRAEQALITQLKQQRTRLRCQLRLAKRRYENAEQSLYYSKKKLEAIKDSVFDPGPEFELIRIPIRGHRFGYVVLPSALTDVTPVTKMICTILQAYYSDTEESNDE